jgi:hypothetical protein
MLGTGTDMNTAAFWQLVATIDKAALAQGSESKALEPLARNLRALPPAELFAFQDHLAQALYDLDGAQFAERAGDSGRSDDGFLYCRCYVVAQGQAHYEQVLSSPTLMPQSDEWCESLLYVAKDAWAAHTGQEASSWPHLTGVSYETGSNSEQWSAGA